MDAFIFDVDGTLWDSTEVVAKSWNQAVSEHTDIKLELSGEGLKHLFGKTMEEIFASLFPSLPQEEQMRLGALCFEYENALLENQPGEIYEGVAEVLTALSKKTDLYIVSNCQCGYIEIFLEASGLTDCVRDHLCYGETFISKGQTIRMLMKRNHLEKAIYVGDTQGDYEACKEAGIPFIFAEYGFGDVPEADNRISKISELLQFT